MSSSNRPDILTILDKSRYDKEAANNQQSSSLQASDVVVGDPIAHIGSVLNTLEEMLPYGELLYQGDVAYERAVFIGNLLYRLTTPFAVVLPRNTDEVQQIVRYARGKGLRLTVKNGGHSYAGYCLNDEGIVLDMSAMKNVEINEQSTVVKIQGGCIWKDVYAQLKAKDQANIIIGGQCPFVGVSGFTLGGGLSPFSRTYGLGVDNVIEMSVVTAEGELVTVHDHETDPDRRDLFWALRGGGGGNFGVTVGFKSKVHQLRDSNGIVVCGQLGWKFPEQEDAFKEMMSTFNRTTWPDELTVDAIWRYQDGALLGQMTVIYNGDMEKCRKVLAPILAFKPFQDDLAARLWSEWVLIEEGFDVKSKVYHHHASFIFGEGAITPHVTEQIIALMKESQQILGDKGKSHILWDHIGGASARIGAKDTAFFWRDGVYVTTVKVQWTDPTMHDTMLDFVKKCKLILEPHAIQQKAAYLNYIDSTVEDWQQAYYGDNYARLQKVKIHWDPTNFFYFDQSIEREGKPKRVRPPNPHTVLNGGVIFDTIPVPRVTDAPVEAEGAVAVGAAAPAGAAAAEEEKEEEVAEEAEGDDGNYDDVETHRAPVGEATATPSVPPVEEPAVFQQTRARWEAYALPDPTVLDGLKNAKDVYGVDRIERIKLMRGF